jgi:predicted dehydrogenase
VKFLVNENWRWHHQIRQFKNILERDTASGKLGKPFRARIAYNSSFPVFENQPFLKNLDQFILTDMGSHILDVARALFGEAKSLYCRTTRVHPEIKGEDVATVIMEMGEGVTVTVEISYASRGTRDRFPETFITVEAEKGGLELGPDFTIYETTAGGTWYKRFYPPQYPWGDPNYLHLSSIVDCQADLLADLRGERAAETRAEDNIKTVRLVFACYDSAERGELIRF